MDNEKDSYQITTDVRTADWVSTRWGQVLLRKYV